MEFFELFSWILRGDGMIRFLGNMTLSDFISTIAFLVVCWYFLNNQIKRNQYCKVNFTLHFFKCFYYLTILLFWFFGFEFFFNYGFRFFET